MQPGRAAPHPAMYLVRRRRVERCPFPPVGSVMGCSAPPLRARVNFPSPSSPVPLPVPQWQQLSSGCCYSRVPGSKTPLSLPSLFPSSPSSGQYNAPPCPQAAKKACSTSVWPSLGISRVSNSSLTSPNFIFSCRAISNINAFNKINHAP